MYHGNYIDHFMLIPARKIKAILKYFCTNTNPEFLGKTKLMKLFYFADFRHVKKYGRSITGDTYYHLEHGPIPSTILNLVNSVLDAQEEAILSDTIVIDFHSEKAMQKILCLGSFEQTDKCLFSESELEILELVCKEFGERNTKYIVDLSHMEAPWAQTKETEKISYTLAASDPDCLVDEELLRLVEKIEG